MAYGVTSPYVTQCDGEAKGFARVSMLVSWIDEVTMIKNGAAKMFTVLKFLLMIINCWLYV